MARTIDNLGLDISNQYAEGREAYDESLVKESKAITSQARVDVTTPFLPSESDSLFGLSERGAVWPAISPPPSYNSSRRRLFAEQVIPSLGTPDAQETQMERLEAFGNSEIDRHPNPADALEIGREQKTLLTLLGKIHDCDQDLIEINARRVQYQKG